ncbi:hypothetical protein BGW80DRAFT_1329433 [Lactifluus volemus]|nr:hypothetical protein BGW80DRAFT_1329433 [Lactifluus volemus]
MPVVVASSAGIVVIFADPTVCGIYPGTTGRLLFSINMPRSKRWASKRGGAWKNEANDSGGNHHIRTRQEKMGKRKKKR